MTEHSEKNLGLKENMRLELFSEEQVFYFRGILNKIDEDAICVKNANGADVPPIIYNSKIRLTGIREDGRSIILYGVICGSSSSFWKIGHLSQYNFYNKRNYYRHFGSIETTVTPLIYDSEAEEGMPCLSDSAETCKVLNISGGGLMFYCKKRFPLNSTIQMGAISLLSAHSPFLLKCQILRITEQDGKYFYNCRFTDLDGKEQERLIREIFLKQAEEIRRRNQR